jgi:hypothetical protein
MIPTNATMEIGIQNRNPPYPSEECVAFDETLSGPFDCSSAS